jgi:hypothetical protein
LIKKQDSKTDWYGGRNAETGNQKKPKWQKLIAVVMMTGMKK